MQKGENGFQVADNTTMLPSISIIMPIRNEADYIGDCLDSVLSQDYPPNLMEVLVVDGMSEDGTREIVQRFINQRGTPAPADQTSSPGNSNAKSEIVLLDNPGRIVSTALNIGLNRARGDIIMRLDGHCLIEPDYARRCVALLAATGADNVGGALQTVGQDLVGRAISLAASSPFGVGGSRFRCSRKPGWVDTVFPGVFRREVFDRIGGFDEELVRNQDDEFNFRLLQAGGRIWLDPTIRIIYFARSSFRSLWRQFFQYGFYKVRVIQKRRQVAAWRHLVPAGFVTGLAITILLSFLTGNKWWLFVVAGPYLFANALASLWMARRDWHTLYFLPIAFLVLHLAYGSGFLWGLWRWRHHWRQNNNYLKLK